MYTHAWKVRKIQMIIVNSVMAAAGAYVGIKDHNLVEGIVLWFFGAWIIETIISAFTKSGDTVSSLALTIGGAILSGIVLSSVESDSIFFGLLFVWNVIKATVGSIIIVAVLIFEFVIFPITTIYYIVKSRQELAMA